MLGSFRACWHVEGGLAGAFESGGRALPEKTGFAEQLARVGPRLRDKGKPGRGRKDMIRLTPNKPSDHRVVIPAPKARGVMPPPTRIRPGRRGDEGRGNGRSRLWG